MEKNDSLTKSEIDKKIDFINMWTSAIISVTSIGFTLSLSTIKPCQLYPLSDDFRLSNFFLFLSVIGVFTFIFFFLITYIIKMKEKSHSENIEVIDFFILFLYCLFTLLSIMFDFSNISYLIYIFILYAFSVLFYLIVVFDVQNNQNKIVGTLFFFISLICIILAFVLKYCNI